MVSRNAAQYIRMSTDTQDLSPSVQKEAIAAYALARDMMIVASYEDDGRSGLRLKNRPGLQRLLRDVTETPGFSVVLVYDVSRWGRFQDADAAAYYEYHCRLHEVEVVYVTELFGAEVNPITTLLKSMKRAMAAEYSRDLSNKSRGGQHVAISRGYQIGPLPPLGYRRCSVSADGSRRTMLEPRQRKIAATDRIEWVLAPEPEVALVQRICQMYVRSRLSLADIAQLGKVEGWRDHEGRSMSGRAIATLIRNEALIGNFVWGRTPNTRGLFGREPSRNDGCLPRIVDDQTWVQMRRRDALEVSRHRTDEEIVDRLKKVFERTPFVTTRDLRAQGLPDRHSIKHRMGSWSELVRRAGQDPSDLHKTIFRRMLERKHNGKALGTALAERLSEKGRPVAFDRRLNVLNFPRLKMRVRLLWPTDGEFGQVWRIRVEQIKRDVEFDLLVRMEALSRARDFFIVEPADLVVRFPHWLTDPVPAELSRFWCGSPKQLLERIAKICDRF